MDTIRQSLTNSFQKDTVSLNFNIKSLDASLNVDEMSFEQVQQVVADFKAITNTNTIN